MSNAQAVGPVQPQDVITDEDVQKALTTDKGTKAILSSWSVEDFTKPGDNYANIVTSVKVKFTLDGREENVSYVVKINSQYEFLKLTEDFSYNIFRKEAGFYTDIAPALTTELRAASMDELRVPKCFHVNMETDRERIFLEDLRSRGFKLGDRKNGLDVAHVNLVIHELAKLHGASVLLLDKIQEKLNDQYSYLTYDSVYDAENLLQFLSKILMDNMSTAEEMLQVVGGYDLARTWISENKNSTLNVMRRQYSRDTPFRVICHGDCWTNNLLFK